MDKAYFAVDAQMVTLFYSINEGLIMIYTARKPNC